MEGWHGLFYSGMNDKSRDTLGVTCLVCKECMENMNKWDMVSERIIKIHLK